MFVAPRVLSIMTTRRCTAACDHCCVGSSPCATTSIPVERIHALIDEATRIPSIERIAFTGGECFLLGRHLDALVRHASSKNFATRAITNGYWAVSELAASARIASLRESGLDEMMLSTGTQHQRFVPVRRIAFAARAAAAAGITTRVSIEACDQSVFDDAWLLEELREPIAARRVFVAYDPWIPDAGERGSIALSHERLFAAGGARPDGRCAQIMNIVTVTPDQQLISCCGYPLEELPRLRIGSVADSPLDETLLRAPNELVKMWLHVAGPAGIAEFVARHIPGWALPPCASICQACILLQRDERAMAALSEHAHEIVQSVTAQFFALQQPEHANAV